MPVNITEFYACTNEELVCLLEMDDFFLKTVSPPMDYHIIFTNQTFSVEKIILDR